MLPFALLALVMLAAPAPRAPAPAEIARWEREARRVTVVRDDWGIAHVRGRSDADAVFGALYAQAEDDFGRIENNYLTALGRLAEAEGETAVFQDLRTRLFLDPDSLPALYASSPAWLRRLMDAFADGLNFYLLRHPEVRPRVLTRFEPWMALAFTEGSIGGDVERVDLPALAAFYGGADSTGPRERGDGVTLADRVARGDGEDPLREPDGSNGIAIAPSLTRDHHALLWINPHTSFYFRSELQMSSDEGLDAYGAVTWGQFFVYQGFNRTAGWMHTSSGVDNIDEFAERVTRRASGWTCRYGGREWPLVARTITVRYRTADGTASRRFLAYFTRHGPVVRSLGDRWVSVSLMRRPVNALIQSYSRTKAADYDAFRRVMALHTNSSNNTVFADARGNIAYFHSNYIPRRIDALDWTKPVDGADTTTAYHGLLSIEETPGLLNPSVGWLYNSNNWPWSAAGPASPRREAFPRYVETGTEETPRGTHALHLLTGSRDWTMEKLTAAGFDTELPAFERLLPALLRAYDAAPTVDSLSRRLAGPVEALRGWDFRWDTSSVATALAVEWGTVAVRTVADSARAAGVSAQTCLAERAGASVLLHALADAVDRMSADFGSWRTPWGAINRFQRLDDSIAPHFDDARPSVPVGFTSGSWGSLASFGARPYPNTKRWYGSSGNSFVAVVEFARPLRANAVTAGGESGDPRSPHFADEVERYVSGRLRDVYFEPAQLVGHTERTYHPGE
jgi:acyl-homoserine-lactone acylase